MPSSRGDPPPSPATPVSLWTCRVDDHSDVDAWLDILDEAERNAAVPMSPPVHRTRFIARRAMRRHVLALAVQCQPAELRFRTGAHGKPVLLPNRDSPVPFFNMSRSGDLIVLAASWRGEIGIDVEEVRPITETIESLFSPGEQRQLARLPVPEHRAAVYRYWTAKEAVLKLLGVGFSVPPEAVDISDPSEPLRVLSIDGDRARAARITLHPVAVREGYIGVLAVCSPRIALEHHIWNGPTAYEPSDHPRID